MILGLAPWVPSPNHGSAMTGHRGLVLHIAEGTFNGTVAWCRNPNSSISAHFVVGQSGEAVQMVDTDLQAWTQSAGNAEWISVECAGYAGDRLTDGQLEFCARLLARLNREYGVPLQLADSPAGRGLGWHGMGGTAWGGHTGCPGAPIVSQRPAIIDLARGIRPAATVPSGDHMQTFMIIAGGGGTVYQTDGVHAFPISSPQELAHRATLAREGSILVNLSTDRPDVILVSGVPVRMVSDRALLGKVLAP